MTIIYLPMNCAVYQRQFIVAAEMVLPFLRRNNSLRLLHNFQLPPGAVGVQVEPLFMAAFTHTPSWPGCPYCGAFDSSPFGGPRLFWVCQACRRFKFSGFNCAGRDSAGRHRCACGHVATNFVSGPVAVCGLKEAAIETLQVTYTMLRWGE